MESFITTGGIKFFLLKQGEFKVKGVVNTILKELGDNEAILEEYIIDNEWEEKVSDMKLTPEQIELIKGCFLIIAIEYSVSKK